MIDYSDQKSKIKKLLDGAGVPSQFIVVKKPKAVSYLKIGVFSNLLKQINAKLRQDLYRINHPCLKNTLLIGIDIIMNGNSKLIGCCATSNKNLTQCYTKMYK